MYNYTHSIHNYAVKIKLVIYAFIESNVIFILKYLKLKTLYY